MVTKTTDRKDRCPRCGRELGRPVGMILQRSPVEGDFGLCGSCGSVLHYVRGDDGLLALALWPRFRPIPVEYKAGLEAALAQAERDFAHSEDMRRADGVRERAGLIIGPHGRKL